MNSKSRKIIDIVTVILGLLGILFYTWYAVVDTYVQYQQNTFESMYNVFFYVVFVGAMVMIAFAFYNKNKMRFINGCYTFFISLALTNLVDLIVMFVRNEYSPLRLIVDIVLGICGVVAFIDIRRNISSFDGRKPILFMICTSLIAIFYIVSSALYFSVLPFFTTIDVFDYLFGSFGLALFSLSLLSSGFNLSHYY